MNDIERSIEIDIDASKEMTMENLKRCPECFHLPQVTIEDKGPDQTNFIFTCTQQNHVHQAMGQDIEMGKANWNLYVMLLASKAA